jgi:hypothetical protein
MRADWDDAPIHIKRKSNGTLRIGIVFVAGCAVTAGALFLGSRQLEQNIAPVPAATQTQPQPQAQGAVMRLSTDIQPARRVEGEKAQALANQLANRQHQSKVPSFHDGNYMPRGATNVVPFEQPRAQAQQRKLQIVVVEEEKRAEDRCNDWYKPGSIELRECRMHVDLNSRNQSYAATGPGKE